MARFFSVLVICSITLLIITTTTVRASGEQEQLLGFLPMKKECKGSIAECLADEEFEMDSDINRRLLDTTKYMTYGALRRNIAGRIPCSAYNRLCFNPGAQANPYRRGCSAITRCRSRS